MNIRKNTLIILGQWISVIILLLIIILIPKTNRIYQLLGPVFIILYFLMPLILIGLQIDLFRKLNKLENKSLNNSYVSIIPFGGLTAIVLLTFINFISSIILERGKLIIICISIMVIIIYLIMTYVMLRKEYKFKRHWLLLTASLFLYYIYVAVGMYVVWWEYLYLIEM